VKKFKSLKAAIFYRLLTSNPLNYRLTTNKGGSHKTLVSPGRLSITFTWHAGVEISGNTVRKILIKRALLTEEEAYKLVHKIK
jgi:predicted RNA binding protein YcfA (HicA-like mRNA interferase family)